MQKFFWNERFKTGNEEIYSEYMEIIILYNELLKLINEQSNTKIIVNNLQYLLECLRKDFIREDAVLIERGCRSDVRQRLHHECQTLLDEIADSIGWDTPEDILRKSTQTLEILGAWLVRHLEEIRKATAATAGKAPVTNDTVR